jgi:hypothetical protein
MIYCPTCENACSDAAQFCPRCGHPLVPPQTPIAQLASVVQSKPPEITPVQVRPLRVPIAGGCPRCGSQRISQRRHASAFCVALLLVGLLFVAVAILPLLAAASLDKPGEPPTGLAVGIGLTACQCPGGIVGVLLCLLALHLQERRGHCRDCRWTWRT